MTTDLQPRRSWTERKLDRRAFLVRGAAATGAALAAMYVAPSLVSTGPRPAYAQVTGPGSCTPGYWKQSQHMPWPSPHDPSDRFDDPVNGFGSIPAPFDTALGGASNTLLVVLQKGGGCEKALGRHAVAALLNSKRVPGFPSPVGDVAAALATAAAAISGGMSRNTACATYIEPLKNSLDDANNGACLDGIKLLADPTDA